LTPLAVLTTLRTVEIQLTPRQKAFVRQAIESGRLHHEEDAVREALALWEQRERARVELLVAFDETEADLEAGNYSDFQRRDATAAGLRAKARGAGTTR
jgi:putative addiction module CopG family antidote